MKGDFYYSLKNLKDNYFFVWVGCVRILRERGYGRFLKKAPQKLLDGVWIGTVR